MHQHRDAGHQMIARLAREMTTILDPSEILSYTAQMIRDWLSHAYVHFFMMNPTSQDLIFVSEASGEQRLIADADLSLPVGQGVAGWVAEHGTLLNVGHVAEEARFNGEMVSDKVVSELAIAIKAGNRVLGVLDVASEREYAFDQDDELILCVVADQLALTLEYAKLCQQLEAAEQQYHNLIEHTQAAILIVDQDGQITFANHQAARLFMFSVTQLHQMTIWDLIRPVSEARLRTCIGPLLYQKTVSQYCDKLVFKTMYGEDRLADAWLWFNQDTDETRSITFYIKDITEQQRMLREIENSRRYLGSVITGLLDGIMILDDRGRIRLGNPALAEMLTLPLEQVVGRQCTDFFPGLWDWLTELEQNGLPIRKTAGTTPLNAEAQRFSWFLHQFKRAEQEIYLEIGVSGLTHGAQKGDRWIAIVRDVTTHKRTEKTLLALSDAAVNIQRVLSTEHIFETVATHLSELGFKLAIVHQNGGHLTLADTSFDPAALTAVEKLLSTPISEIAIPVERVTHYQELMNTHHTIFVADGPEFIQSLLPKPYPRIAARIAHLLRIGNMVLTPFVIQDRIEGAFLVTAPVLNPTDISAISIFTAQFNITWETARLYQEARAQAADLETAIKERTHELQLVIHELFQKERNQRNISKELLHTNRALQAEKQRTEAILRSVADGLIAVDETGHITLINPAAEKMLGVLAEELVGTLLNECEYVNVCRFSQVVLNSAQTQDMVEFELIEWDKIPEQDFLQAPKCERQECFLAQDGKTKGASTADRQTHCALEDCPIYQELATLTLQAHRSSIVDETNRTVGTVVALNDITRLKEVDRLKSQFVSSVSHELRTPLTNIKIYLSLLRDGRPEKRERYLQIVTTEAERLERLIQDVLDLSRLDASATQKHHQPVSIPELVERVIEIHLPRAAEKNIAIEFETSQDLPMFLGNADHFVQVLTNLLSNAVQYTMPGGQVLVGASYFHDGQWSSANHPVIDDMPSGEWGVLWVSDTGIGITPEEQNHLYERFYRGSVEKLGIPGTGLGLAIVKEIVELYRGHIFLSSEKGVGSTFAILLPVISEEKGQPRVIVVDDDPTVADIIGQFLRLLGCQVQLIADGAAGFAKVSSDPPDLMVLDVSLPGMDGITILTLLSALPATKDMPILIVTGRQDISEAYVKQLGAVALLNKPFSRQEFSERVSSLLALDKQ